MKPLGEILGTLRQRGADRLPHTFGRSLLDHLFGTFITLSYWKAKSLLMMSGLFHSCYSTHAYQNQLFSMDDRESVKALIGQGAEEYAYLFCKLNIRCILKHVNSISSFEDETLTIEHTILQKETVADLLLIEMANTAEQTGDEAGLPRPFFYYLFKLNSMREKLEPGCQTPELFSSAHTRISQDDEKESIVCYIKGLTELKRNFDEAVHYFDSCILLNPFVAEPWFFLATMYLEKGRRDQAVSCISKAICKFNVLGTSWDKRQSFNQWLSKCNQLYLLTNC